jgi:hypothetical protein
MKIHHKLPNDKLMKLQKGVSRIEFNIIALKNILNLLGLTPQFRDRLIYNLNKNSLAQSTKKYDWQQQHVWNSIPKE